MKSEFDRYDTEIATLVVDADMRGREPLRDCVRQSIETYFETLSGQSASGLYQMVLAEVEKPLIETANPCRRYSWPQPRHLAQETGRASHHMI